jgi:uncharacterized membrane protein YkvA (DUF1232 family)
MKRWKWLAALPQRGRIATYLLALWKLFRNPRTPWLPRLVAVAVLAYAVSPIDLIPDFIPFLGQLDDLILVPLGVALAVRLTPKPLWQQMLAEAERTRDKLPRLIGGAVVIVLLWVAVAALLAWWLWPHAGGTASAPG